MTMTGNNEETLKENTASKFRIGEFNPGIEGWLFFSLLLIPQKNIIFEI